MSDDVGDDDTGADWAGAPYPGSPADDGPGEIAPSVVAGDFVNGQGLLGMARTADVGGGAAFAGANLTNGPADPYDIYDWVRRLGDQGIASQMRNGRLSVFETPDISLRNPLRPRDPPPFKAVNVDEYVPGQQDDQPAEWRRYPAPNDVAEDLGHPIAQDTGAFGAARDYLSRDPVSAAMGARIDAAHIPMVMIPDGNDRFEVSPSRSNGIVYWNPTLGLQVPAGPTLGSVLDSLLGRAPVQSPSMLLDREFGHADEWLRDPAAFANDARAQTGDDWDNLEEKRNIQDVETPAAQRLGEPTRASHRGTYVPAPTVPRRK